MKIGILGCKGTTLDLIHNIRQRAHLNIAQVVTLNEEKAQKNGVAFYSASEIETYCAAHGLPCHKVKSYDLKDVEDLEFFAKAQIDLLVVIGWERLIPDSVLNTLKFFACGMHGSAYGLPKGRGRSPMNWAVLTGHHKFITYLFRYTPGMDDGDLIGFKCFDINPFDDIGTLHAKNRIVMGNLIHSYAEKISAGSVTFFQQPDDLPTYYPKRTRADGALDWHQSSEQIHRLVRAVAPPYPGAFTKLRGIEYPVLRGQPFDSGLFDQGIPPGTVVDIQVSLKRLVVKTGDGAFLVSDLGADTRIDDFSLGDRFESASSDKIIDEIRGRYPDFVGQRQREI